MCQILPPGPDPQEGDYLTWINTHQYGTVEKVHPNNHGVCWSLQAAAFADLVGDEEILAWIRNQFKTVYLADKDSWPRKPDVQYWDDWPVRQPSLIFAGLKFNEPSYLELWQSLEPDPTTYEVLRNLPLRHPLLWVPAEQARNAPPESP